jgi:hypothetical protein
MTGPQAETWRPCPEFEELYLISSLARVMRIKAVPGCRAGRVHKQWLNSRGYPSVSLHKLCKHYKSTVHRLLASAFLQNDIGADESRRARCFLPIKCEFADSRPAYPIENMGWLSTH